MFESSEQDLADSQLSMDQSVTLQFDFHFESLSIVLYNNDINQVCTNLAYLKIYLQLFIEFGILVFFYMFIHKN